VIAELEHLVQGELRPDLTLILDIEPTLGLGRALQCGEPDRFESEAVAFFDRVRAAYQQRAVAAPKRYAIVDAGQPLVAVQRDIETVLEGLSGWL
jgi:dTMP kinase